MLQLDKDTQKLMAKHPTGNRLPIPVTNNNGIKRLDEINEAQSNINKQMDVLSNDI